MWWLPIPHAQPELVFGHLKLLIQDVPKHRRSVGGPVDRPGDSGAQNPAVEQAQFICLMMAHGLPSGIADLNPPFYRAEPLVIISGDDGITHAQRPAARRAAARRSTR